MDEAKSCFQMRPSTRAYGWRMLSSDGYVSLLIILRMPKAEHKGNRLLGTRGFIKH
jgi:hypothetical protein